MAGRKFFTILISLILLCCIASSAAAQDTLKLGSSGQEVKELQTELIEKGYLSGEADGKFDKETEQAVKKFQKANGLTTDGKAGVKTISKLYGASAKALEREKTTTSKNTQQTEKQNTRNKKTAQNTTNTKTTTDTKTSKDTKDTKDTTTAKDTKTEQNTKDTKAAQNEKDTKKNDTAKTTEKKGTGYFGYDLSTIDKKSDPARIKKLQQALIKLGYLKGNDDGIIGAVTTGAVKDFQKASNLKATGTANTDTLEALELAYKKGEKKAEPEEQKKLPAGAGKIDAPSKSSIELLYWFKDIKPKLKNGNKLLVYDPKSKLAWTLRVYSRGRHCECEPLTEEDTLIMMKAFDGKYTWSQKGVYVQLPDGRWTVGAVHNVEQGAGTIKDNGFDGHLGLHFMRDWDECTKNDPYYGISNQQTIRQIWKSVSGVYVE